MTQEIKLPTKYTQLSREGRRLIREEYVHRQDGLCYHCQCSLDGEPSENIKLLVITKKLFPPNFFKYPVHLHHSHETGMTIGAVHAYCNAVLWEYFNE